ncbi:protein of unknown function [Legionella fallonii LLAP-10]|uniref:Uncharacterized protein n=1 Tax=Legionella fallonii LLAP-10 TaxID=1212491 RepID=A0A098G1T9_9GAMM|nr:protein of unknown function [Legionella fallonii LLAP-10]
MNCEQFQMWVKGYLDLSSETSLSIKQIKIIYHHALLVKVINKINDSQMDDIICFLNELKKEKGNILRKRLDFCTQLNFNNR